MQGKIGDTRSGRAATKARNVSRKDAKAAKKIPLSSPFGKGGKRGILPKWCLADAVQAWHENDLKHLKLNKKEFAQAAAGASSA
jgi:hypothetical protein